MKVYTKKSALNYLMGNTHLFFEPEVAEALSQPFGFKARCYIAKADPRNPKGLTFHDGRKQGEGIASWDLARQIADHYDVRAEDKFGRGSQQRAYVEATAKHLNIKL